MRGEGTSSRAVTRASGGDDDVGSLSCPWLLVKERSESMVPYLRLMGLSEMAIEAWTKAEMETDTYKVIDFLGPPSRPSGVRIMKQDRVQNQATEYSFGSEVRTESKLKGQPKKVLVAFKNKGHLVVKSILPLKNGSICSLVETLRASQGPMVGDAGLREETMHQELVATNLTGGKSVTVHRYYKKTDPLPEIDDEADEDDT